MGEIEISTYAYTPSDFFAKTKGDNQPPRGGQNPPTNPFRKLPEQPRCAVEVV